MSGIGEVADYADENKLAAYFGIIPKVSNSNETVRIGRITKRGSKMGRTTLVQCTLAALRSNQYLKKYYEQVKHRRGYEKAKIAVAFFGDFEQNRYLANEFLADPTILGVADSFGIEMCHPVREKRFPERKRLGKKGKSNSRWIVGGKLCVVLNKFGLALRVSNRDGECL